MLREEPPQPLGHALRILDLQQMRGPGKHERLYVRKPVEQQLVALPPDRIELQAPLAHYGEHRLNDPPGVCLLERPLPQGRQFLLEERLRIGDMLLERTG